MSVVEDVRFLLARFDQIFYRAYDWVYKEQKLESKLGVETTVMGMVRNCLHHAQQTPAAKKQGLTITKEEFALAVARGFGGNLPFETYRELAKNVMQWAEIRCPADPTKVFFDRASGQLVRYDTSGLWLQYRDAEPFYGTGLSPFVQTLTSLRDSDFFVPWLRNEQPVVLAGPQGCGKNTLIRHALLRLQSEEDEGGTATRVNVTKELYL